MDYALEDVAGDCMLLLTHIPGRKRERAADDRKVHCGALRPRHGVWSVTCCIRTDDMCAHRQYQPLGPRIVVWIQRITTKVS